MLNDCPIFRDDPRIKAKLKLIMAKLLWIREKLLLQ